MSDGNKIYSSYFCLIHTYITHETLDTDIEMDAANNNVTPIFDRDLLEDVCDFYAGICTSIIQNQMTSGQDNIFRIFNFNPDP